MINNKTRQGREVDINNKQHNDENGYNFVEQRMAAADKITAVGPNLCNQSLGLGPWAVGSRKGCLGLSVHCCL